jgi:hypothetical protein
VLLLGLLLLALLLLLEEELLLLQLLLLELVELLLLVLEEGPRTSLATLAMASLPEASVASSSRSKILIASPETHRCVRWWRHHWWGGGEEGRA